MILSVDFDGTLTLEDTHPAITQLDEVFIVMLKIAQKRNHIIVLNTCRRDGLLDEAMKALHMVGFVPNLVNCNCPSVIKEYGDTRKIFADFYYDDRSFNWDRASAIAHVAKLCK